MFECEASMETGDGSGTEGDVITAPPAQPVEGEEDEQEATPEGIHDESPLAAIAVRLVSDGGADGGLRVEVERAAEPEGPPIAVTRRSSGST
jgi:hypothetical protein